ncbi:protein phosphatase 2C domain-containing protein [Mailhella massiliensis]|uniref:Protein phosphatase 2C domain-containing protein n=1 Tax=Mailhella massiliensis TaxID=1903261 RepID=A0A921DTN6_9BACT|nr:protein phosphatase 2C domain-containing protein [Mailhella massiliensis]HJD98282.1 protein phosphatase 2C domain-containing protein [Mailhella massiliensis]
MSEFLPRFVRLVHEGSVSIPFSVGGCSQHGPHAAEDQNNQDAMSLDIDAAAMIGVVCDGCSSASDLGENRVSYAETGAQILSALMVRHIRELLQQDAGMPVEKLAGQAGELCLEDIWRILGILCGKDAQLKEHFLREFFMATILVAVITPVRWFVLHCGDGCVAVNGEFFNLNEAYSGEYLANGLSSDNVFSSPPELHLFRQGDIADLKSLVIASDGMQEIHEKSGELLENMLSSGWDKRKSPYTPGFDRDFLREFRVRVAFPWEDAGLSSPAHDDRTLIMFRRLPDMATASRRSLNNDRYGSNNQGLIS